MWVNFVHATNAANHALRHAANLRDHCATETGKERNWDEMSRLKSCQLRHNTVRKKIT